MNDSTTTREGLAGLPALLRGDIGAAAPVGRAGEARGILWDVLVIFVGVGLYGAAAGCWRSPLQAGYLALKLPLIVLATTFVNALLNGMLAPLLGLNIPLRRSLRLVLMSFVILALILSAFSPLVLFLNWNMPTPPAETGAAKSVYYVMVLANVTMIAFAGVTGVVRLFGALCRVAGSPAIARRVLFCWLAGNLFLGAQISWVLRPFIGSPGIEVEFIREDALEGNFYESVFRQMQHFLKP